MLAMQTQNRFVKVVKFIGKNETYNENIQYIETTTNPKSHQSHLRMAQNNAKKTTNPYILQNQFQLKGPKKQQKKKEKGG